MIIREMNVADIKSVRAITAHTWRDSTFVPVDIQRKVLRDANSSAADFLSSKIKQLEHYLHIKRIQISLFIKELESKE